MDASPKVTVSGFADCRLVARLAAAARRVLRKLRCPSLSVALREVSPHEAAALNRRFRGRAGSAEVLAFSLAPDEPGGIAGEVCICPKTAFRRAARLGIPRSDWAEELAVHGILHALGFHHGSREASREMFALQRSLTRVKP